MCRRLVARTYGRCFGVDDSGGLLAAAGRDRPQRSGPPRSGDPAGARRHRGSRRSVRDRGGRSRRVAGWGGAVVGVEGRRRSDPDRGRSRRRGARRSRRGVVRVRGSARVGGAVGGRCGPVGGADPPVGSRLHRCGARGGGRGGVVGADRVGGRQAPGDAAGTPRRRGRGRVRGRGGGGSRGGGGAGWPGSGGGRGVGKATSSGFGDRGGEGA